MEKQSAAFPHPANRVTHNSIRQPVIRHFHNACACGIHPFHPVFLQKQIFCRLKKLHIYKAFYSLFALYIERFLFVKSILRSYTCLLAKSDFLPIGSDYFSFTSMIQIFYYFLCPISDTVHFLNPFPLIFMLLFRHTKLYQIKRNTKDVIS